MRLEEWISAYLSCRGLNKPDGRPLFAYKTTSDEFTALGEQLQNLPAHQRTQPAYPQAWLLFAAEWWKREYAGGAWRWAPLFAAAGLTEPSHDQIRKLVISGRRLWQLETEIQAGGKRFLGLVAVNGGLPMRLVESAHGGLAGLLSMVLKQALRFDLSEIQLRQAIQDQAALLPTCYQQLAVYELLGSLIQAVLSLRREFQLQDAPDPISKLHECCPAWAERFPLSLDTQAANRLIKGLVKTATEAGTQASRRFPFQIQRGLRFSSDDTPPVFELSFSMQAQIGRSQLLSVLGMDDNNSLPPHFQLLLRVGSNEYPAGEALLRGESYHLISWSLPAIRDLYASVKLVVSRFGATLHTASLPGGDPLAADEPLVLENRYPFARLLAQGDTSIPEDSALLLAPAKAIVFPEKGDVVARFDCLAGDLKLLQLPIGITRFSYHKQSFIITVGCKTATLPNTYWHGRTISALVSLPALVFAGMPGLRVEQGAGDFSAAPAHELYARTSQGLQPVAQSRPMGLCRLVWRKNGQSLLSTKAVILDERADIHFLPASAQEGEIHLLHWPNLPVCCDSPDVEFRSRHDGTRLIIYLRSLTTAPQITITLRLQWPAGEQVLQLPFPGQGAVLVRNQQVLKFDQKLTLDELIGSRAVLMSAQGANHWLVRLSTLGPDGQISLSQDIRYTGTREIRLFELIPAIRQLLSCHPGLDHVVQLELVHAHKVQAKLRVGRYSTSIRPHSNRQMVSLSQSGRDLILDEEQAQGLLLALSLAEPEHDPIPLPLHFSEQTFTGSWLVELPADIPGPWMLYMPADTAYHSRPTVMAGPCHTLPDTSDLRRALCEGQPDQRMRLLSAALQQMQQDAQHPDWPVMEALLDRLHHLPLASLDICQALIRNPEALVMAMLLLDDCASNLATRLPSELPFEWLLISPGHWLNVFARLSQQLATSDVALRVIRRDIQRKTQYLQHWQPALRFIIAQGLHHHLGEKSPDVRLFTNNADWLLDTWLEQLFRDEHAEMHQMLQRNSNSDLHWPTLPEEGLVRHLSQPNGRLLLDRCRLPHKDHKLSVVLLPFIVAFDACSHRGQQWQNNPSHLHTLRHARQFDPIWFDAAYQVGLAMAQVDLLRK